MAKTKDCSIRLQLYSYPSCLNVGAVDHIVISLDDRLGLHVVVHAVLAALSSKTRLLDTTETVECVSLVHQWLLELPTYGAAASEMTPVLTATIP